MCKSLGAHNTSHASLFLMDAPMVENIRCNHMQPCFFLFDEAPPILNIGLLHGCYDQSGMQTICPMRMQAKDSDYIVNPAGFGLHCYM